MSSTKSLNIYNVTDMEEYIGRVISDVKEPHIRTWFQTTYARWFRQQDDNVRIMLPGALRNLPEPFGLRANDTADTPDRQRHELFYFVDDVPKEQWAVDAMLRGQLMWWVEPRRRATGILRHWIDYMRTLPDRKISHSVDAMIQAVQAYDTMLERQKLIDDLNDGITLVASNGQYKLVRLDTQGSVRAEGACMKHCIWTNRYDLNAHTTLFSVRSIETGLPVASIEVRKVRVEKKAEEVSRIFGVPFSKRETLKLDGVALMQVCGIKNRPVADDVQAFVNSWFADSDDVTVNLVCPPKGGNPKFEYLASGTTDDDDWDEGEGEHEDDDDDAEDEDEDESDEDLDEDSAFDELETALFDDED